MLTRNQKVTIEEPVSKQRIGKHTTTGVLLETVFSVGAATRVYNEDLRQLRQTRPLVREGAPYQKPAIV
jgi:hypothetical protein